MNKKSILLLIPAFFLASCVKNNGLCFCENSVDENGDGICDKCDKRIEGTCAHEDLDGDLFCDKCGAPLEEEKPGPCKDHVDNDMDGVCDICHADISKGEHSHVDGNKDGKCDICGAAMQTCTEHVDTNGDSKCDNCGADMSSPYIPPKPTGPITTYLVLSSVGLYKGQPGTLIADKNLEYAVAFTEEAGKPLPGKDEITHLYGNADFAGWLCYEGQGAPTVYTVVPNEANKILYANFVDNGKTPVDPIDPIDPNPPVPGDKVTYYLRTDFADGSGNWDVPFAQRFYAYVWKGDNSAAYELTYVSESLFSFEIPKNTYTCVIFTRSSNDAEIFSWDTVYNQTVDAYFEEGKTTAQIVNWGPGPGAKSDIKWIS